MSGFAFLRLAFALALAAAAGSALLSQVFSAAGGDDEGRRDAALALGLPAGLLLAAFPGWLPSAFFRVSLPSFALPLAGLTLFVVVAVLRVELRGLFGSGRKALFPLLVLLGVFAFFLWLRYWPGEIRQTEKPMDFAILNRLMTGTALPLGDPWLSGERFSYYHFGTYVLSIPMRAALVPPEYAYNLLCALVAALAAAAAFGGIRLRGGGRGVALFGALLLVLGGTFDGARQLLLGTPLGGIDVWVSSRRVQNAITEWPFFTLWLGDLHPHAVAMPLLVALVGVAGRVAAGAGLALDALLLAALLSANPWDLPAALLALAAGNLTERSFRLAVVRSVGTCLLAAPLLLPFLLSPRPPFQGLRTAAQKTTAPEAFLHFGALLVIPALALGVALVRSRKSADESLFWATLFPALGLALAVLTQRPVLGLAAGFLLGVAYLWRRSEGALKAGLLLSAAGAALVAVPEVVVVTDPYGEAMHRMNTIFKCYAGGAIFFALGSALLLPLSLAARRARVVIRVLLAGALYLALAHPRNAFVARWKSSPGTLDGLAWLSATFPGDRAAVDWLRKNASPDAVVAEASGGAYDDRGRIGTASGRPTLLGWAGHEGVWRGEAAAPEVPRRQEELKRIYTSADLNQVRAILARRKIDFVVVGPLEKTDFGADAFPARGAFKTVVNEQGTALYAVGAP